MSTFGSPVPSRLAVPASTTAAFPHAPGTYTSSDGAIVVPPGALDRWFTWRATGGATRRDVIAFGDSTTFGSNDDGSGQHYSWLTRLRARAVAAGLPDGGKGMFAGQEGLVTYDAGEVNGFVATTFAGSSDTFDNIAGLYFVDDNHVGATLDLQFVATGFRLWYSERVGAGAFTYSLDGGSAVTVTPATTGTVNKFVYVSGLSAGTTHTLRITNTGGGRVWIALAPVNATGIATQKHGINGGTFQNFFYGAITPASPFTQANTGMQYQTALGLVPTSVSGEGAYRGAPVDSSYSAAAKVYPILAMTHLGFNDLTSRSTESTQAWKEYVKRFAGACYDASCDGIVISGQLPYNAQWPANGLVKYQALKDEALAQGLGFVDLLYPVEGVTAPNYTGGTKTPHLTKAKYQTQADYLWDNVLAG